LKLICTRTLFKQNLNAFPINGKLIGEDYVANKKGKIYKYKEPKDYERAVGVYLIVESERTDFWLPIKESEFKKHFKDINENRNKKIDEILNR
jgi:hypothetical protein